MLSEVLEGPGGRRVREEWAGFFGWLPDTDFAERRNLFSFRHLLTSLANDSLSPFI